jgi:hypothetical protein
MPKKSWFFSCFFLLYLRPGAYPTIVSYYANIVTVYNTTSSLARFTDINIFSYFEKNTFYRLPTSTQVP